MSARTRTWRLRDAAIVVGLLIASMTAATAQVLPFAPLDRFDQMAPTYAPDQIAPEDSQLPPQLQRQVVAYQTNEPAGTIIVDTAHTYLYLTLGGGRALRYGIGVGRQGFTWSGVETITRKAEWPDWIPPAQMIARQPYLPRFVAGGPGNPLGARALYLGNTDYRIHGTNDPTTIGKRVSSGCIRLDNADVIDLYNRVGIGTKVVVLPANPRDIPVGDQRMSTIGSPPGRMAARIQVGPAKPSASPNVDEFDHADSSGIY